VTFLTPQQIFDKVATHLMTQGKQAHNERNECVYRGLGGTSCAMGCLIPDECYDQGMEDRKFFPTDEPGMRTGTAVSEKFPEALVAAGIDASNAQVRRLCRHLQCGVHDLSIWDSESTVDTWVKALKATALLFHLSITNVPQLQGAL